MSDSSMFRVLYVVEARHRLEGTRRWSPWRFHVSTPNLASALAQRDSFQPSPWAPGGTTEWQGRVVSFDRRKKGKS